jgi:NADPH-dependent 2,4-dienoyl-CoA reductase/sulfur reductase-like enzyme
MGRALLADPELPNKAAEGRFDDIAPCIACGLGCGVFGKTVTCLINPALGSEEETVIRAAAHPKKVLVAGGGPAGLEAAQVAALRGHKVTLCEKSPKLGGQFNLAAMAPMKQELTKVIKYLSTQVEKAGVKIQVNKEVTPELVEETKADVVIVAVGGEPMVPNLPGVGGKRIFTAHDILAGKAVIKPGNVVVVGGGMVGCEVAKLLANPADARPDLRVTVTIVEMLNDVALDMAGHNKALLLEHLRDKEVKILTLAKVKEFLEGGIVIVKDGQEVVIRGVDSIVLAMGAESADKLSGRIKDKGAEVYVIGDAKEPRKALEAIAEGAEIGRNI